MSSPAIPNKSMKITAKQMAQQWASASHKLGLNCWNFEVRAAKKAVAVFQKSFDLGRFNASGTPGWEMRVRKYKHPILNETGTLKRSIEWKKLDSDKPGNRAVRVFTNPAKFGTAKRHKGFCYAAIHNAPNGSELRTGHANNIPQRQFMGHSDILSREIQELIPTLFIGLP